MTTNLPSLSTTLNTGRKRFGIAAAIVAAFYVTSVFAQAPVAPSSASAPQAAADLENLVGRIALYPDDLIAIILPASTNPLQIVPTVVIAIPCRSDRCAPNQTGGKSCAWGIRVVINRIRCRVITK